tara:strand:- start:146 stop:730 length:585 start_codon:yes stop_codon:yes gene_type:complete
MMSSEISTNPGGSSFRAWHFFALVGLVAATVSVITVQPTDTAALVLLVLAVGAGAYVGFGIYRAVLPLVSQKFSVRIETVGGRTRAALDREKTLVLRAIKELEFDRAMGKVSDDDFSAMGGKLRARARELLKQLDVDGTTYRDLIERELAERLGLIGLESTGLPEAPTGRQICDSCGIKNDEDAQFCKGCGAGL